MGLVTAARPPSRVDLCSSRRRSAVRSKASERGREEALVFGRAASRVSSALRRLSAGLELDQDDNVDLAVVGKSFRMAATMLNQGSAQATVAGHRVGLTSLGITLRAVRTVDHENRQPVEDALVKIADDLDAIRANNVNSDVLEYLTKVFDALSNNALRELGSSGERIVTA